MSGFEESGEFGDDDQVDAFEVDADDGEESESPQQPLYVVTDELRARGLKDDAFSAEDADYVEQARAKGWVPPERYKGDLSGYVGPKRFVERGRASPGYVRKENDDLRQQLAEINRRMEEQAVESRKRELSKMRQGFNSAVRELQGRMQEAVQKGDVRGFNELRRRESDLINQAQTELRAEEQRIEEQEGRLSQLDPKAAQELQQWQAENSWYGSDERRTKLADQVAQRIVYEAQVNGQRPPMGLDLVEATKREVMEIMPLEESKPSRQSHAARSESPQSMGGAVTSVASMGPEYAAAFAEFYEDHGPKGTGMYSSKAKAEKAFVSMAQGGQEIWG